MARLTASLFVEFVGFLLDKLACCAYVYERDVIRFADCGHMFCTDNICFFRMGGISFAHLQIGFCCKMIDNVGFESFYNNVQ